MMLKIYIDFRVADALFAIKPTLELCEKYQLPVQWLPIRCDIEAPLIEHSKETKGETHARIKQDLASKTNEFYADLYGMKLNPGNLLSADLALACLLQLTRRQQDFVEQCIDAFWFQAADLNDESTVREILSGLSIDQHVDLSEGVSDKLTQHYMVSMKNHGFLHSPSYVLDESVFIGRQHLPLLERMVRERLASE
ncbi:MAG: hypothetical protein VXZ35_07520 [Pseudomonadota bacterium]|nr:hypothetical protein [Pseudomonadota bacterium]